MSVQYPLFDKLILNGIHLKPIKTCQAGQKYTSLYKHKTDIILYNNEHSKCSKLL